MSVQVSLPDLAEQIDQSATATSNEVDRINELADELNREAEDVLEYQVSGVEP